MIRNLTLLMSLVLPLIGLARDVLTPEDLTDVGTLAWLAGDWRLDQDDRLVQEIWTTPRAGSMTGMFRMITGGRVTVLEYIVVAEEAAGVFYQFKHFRPDYTTWEGENPPIRMKLVESQAGRAVFENTVRVEGQPAFITYRLEADGRLAVFVGDKVGSSGEYQGFKFVLSKEVPMPTDQRINYLELPARDLDAVQKFYEGAFEWSFVDYGPEYRAFNDGFIDGGFYRSEAKSSASGNGAVLIVIYADDLAGAEQAVVRNGGAVLKPTFSFPGGRRFHFADPNGNELAVWSDQ